MVSISLCIIVKNEEKNLGNLLESISGVPDEIIIVDTGSTDKTKEIAKKYTNNIYDFKWCNDFSKARNFSLSKATKEYIMWLDADDIILKKDKEKLIKLKNNLDQSIDYIMLKYALGVDENLVPSLEYYRERIFKNNSLFKFVSPIHETVNVFGKGVKVDITITHNKKSNDKISSRNLDIFEGLKKQGYNFTPRDTFYYARELYYNKKYKKAISYFNKFLNMKDAWIENKISACIDLANIYYIKNDEKNYLKYLFKTFEYTKPRAEVCCKIGNLFLFKKSYDIAKFWYETALKDKYDISNGGFYCKDYYDFIPYINLCVCYFFENDIKKANMFNELAGIIKPQNKTYLNNKDFFIKYSK